MVKNDVMSTEEMMGKANLALADMGRAAAGLVPHMKAMGRIIDRMDYLMREQIAYYNLQWMSRATQEEIRDHLKHWTGSIFDLEAFYRRFNCFPSQLDTKKWGTEVMAAYISRFKQIDWDLILMEKSPRLVQGVLLLMLLILLFLEHF